MGFVCLLFLFRVSWCHVCSTNSTKHHPGPRLGSAAAVQRVARVEHCCQELISSELLIVLNDCWKEPNNHEWTSASLVINIVITELLIIIRPQSREHQRFCASPRRHAACLALVLCFTALSLFWTCLWLTSALVRAQKILLIDCKKLCSFQTPAVLALRQSLFWGHALWP